MGINLNSKNARTQFQFLETELTGKLFRVVKANLNKTQNGTEEVKFFCAVDEGEHKGKIVLHRIFWTEKNEFRIREFALNCNLPIEPRRDENGVMYDHIMADYPADFVNGVFRADAENVSDADKPAFFVLKNIVAGDIPF